MAALLRTLVEVVLFREWRGLASGIVVVGSLHYQGSTTPNRNLELGYAGGGIVRTDLRLHGGIIPQPQLGADLSFPCLSVLWLASDGRRAWMCVLMQA